MIAAYRATLVLFLALVVAALLQAEGLRKQAQIQPAGVQRRVALAATRPLVEVSRALHLTTPVARARIASTPRCTSRVRRRPGRCRSRSSSRGIGQPSLCSR